MLTRNFFSCFVRGNSDSEYLTYKSNIISNPSLYRKYINPEGKIYVQDDVDSSDTEYVTGIYANNPGSYSLSMVSNTLDRAITDMSLLDIDKDDNGNTVFGSVVKGDENGCPHIFFGSGTTAPTFDDYKLESCITTYSRNKIGIHIDKNLQTITASLTFTPSSNMTVTEMGLYVSGYNSYGASYSGKTVKNLLAMVARTVLSSPVTFNAGTTYTVDYTIDFKTNTDSVSA